jgi:hypothetical protein
MTARIQWQKKNSGREYQGAWRQDELNGGLHPPLESVTKQWQ